MVTIPYSGSIHVIWVPQIPVVVAVVAAVVEATHSSHRQKIEMETPLAHER